MNINDLKRLIRRVDDLPTLPRTVFKITELVNSPKSSARDLARVVADDQVLTARLLRLVNSSFYGFPQRVSTVTGAIVLLGFDAIRNLLLTTSVFDLFSPGQKKNFTDHGLLWDHSLGCAVGAKVIGHHIRYEKIEELFVCGLLHDIGKIVEMRFLPREFERITSLVQQENLLIAVAEERVLGFNHAAVGALLVEGWNLPANLAAVVGCHHQPADAGRFSLEAAVVHCADILCRALDTGSGGDAKIPPLDPNAWQSLELKTETIETIMDQMAQAFEDIRPFATEKIS